MRTIHRTIIPAVIVAVYILTAIHSNGYHHPDEHYQIIEFAGLKGGWNTDADLCWEYDAQIRPALQPMLALSVFKFLGMVGISSPFHLALALRMLTAIFALFCISYFVRSFQAGIEAGYRRVFMLLSFLLWFLPAINVRFSSETWAGLTFLLSVALLNKAGVHNRVRTCFLAGILWGFSFEFRYQMAVALLGLFLWLVLVRREKIRNLLALLSGSLAVVLACTLLDAWFYGEWVIAPWNYFYKNMVEGVASSFGVSPWYFYLAQMLNAPTPLIGMLLFAALALVMLFDYKNVVLWCLLPFIVIHSMIPHKELRFLFPMVNFVPLIMILAYQQLAVLWKNKAVLRSFLFPVVGIALLINLGGLAMLALKPASDGNIDMLQYIDNQHNRVNLYTIGGSNPYVLGYNIKGLTPRFYANERVTIKDLSEVIRAKSLTKLNADDLVMLYASYHEFAYLEKEGFRVEKKSIPDWIAWLDRFYKVYDSYQFVFVLYSKDNNLLN